MSKTDRLARFHLVERLLYQHPEGLSIAEIADRCSVSPRTAYRDIDALSEWCKVPIWQNNGKYGIEDGYYLPAISFSLPEAISIFLASRLMLRYSNKYDPGIASTFDKLNTVVPPSLRTYIEQTIDWMETLKTDERSLHALRAIGDAWVNRRTVKILYHTLGDETAKERLIDPYFIEPAGAGHSSYVIAYCHRAKERRTFKIERVQSFEVTSESYDIPPEFNADELLAPSIGIRTGGKPEVVKLRLSPVIARIFDEVIYHQSQKVEPESDGSAIMTLTVLANVELFSWIIGWGENMEVLEPEWVRMEITETARMILDIYKQLPLFLTD